MSKNAETTTHLPDDEDKLQPTLAPAVEQQRAPFTMTSSDGPLLSRSILPGTPLLPGTNTQFPQEFNSDKSESDGSGENGLDLGYGATSSEDEKPIEPLPREETSPLNNQPVQTVQINQPVHTEPTNQPVQTEQNIQTPSETIKPSVGK
jgi:hypothetical protein